MRIAKQIIVFTLLLSIAACQRNIFESSSVAPSTLRDVPALRLNFRYEADVPAPTEAAKPAPAEEKNASVQADFDANRGQEILVRTIPSPNNQRLLTVYQRLGDPSWNYRIDMYAADGRFLRHVSPESMAVRFPDIIVWSPDSGTVAFVAVALEGGINSLAPLPSANANTNSNTPAGTAANSSANTNSNTDANAGTAPAVQSTPAPDAAPNVITFRTEQIYICNSEGLDLKPITQNEGLIYYYFVWSPDNSALAAMAATYQEWTILQNRARTANEVFLPLGRPRLVEKNGRERRLDDNLTTARPVWSPDSAKVAVGYNSDNKPTQIRIYDAAGDQPTQAAIPVRNQLLISSQDYDRKVNSEQNPQTGAAPDTNANTNTNPSQPSMTLPDEKTLVSFQPIIALEWSAENMLYFQTGFVKQYTSGDGARSSLRWHRLVLSPQATAIK